MPEKAAGDAGDGGDGGVAGLELNTVCAISLESIEAIVVRLTVHQDKLQALAKLDSISRIEKVRRDELLNNLARGTLMADVLALSTSYEGAGQKICVADTGFDQGKIQEELGIQVHPAFKGRIEFLDSLWLKDDHKDTQGHGTHVCASICGTGLYNPGNIRVMGTAPAATLMVQSIATISDDLNKGAVEVPIDLGRDLFTKAYERGFRIHSNSRSKKWDENTGQLGYEGQAWDIDEFVNDHQDFLDKAAQSGLMQNDINPIVLSGGTERHGNVGKASDFDHTNNVEKVIWENVPGDTFKIVVSIFNNVDVKAAASFAVAWDIRPLARL